MYRLRRTQDSLLLVSSYTYIDSGHSRTQFANHMEAIGTVAAVLQLVTTLNLLGQPCKDAKDARRIIQDARGDLTRLSILLKQLMPHAKHNNDDSRLLALNISNCAKRAITVRAVVEKMKRRIERAPPIGRLCAVLMSIELKHLLDELDSAEKEMDRTFTTYCFNRRMSVRIRGTLKTWSSHADGHRKIHEHRDAWLVFIVPEPKVRVSPVFPREILDQPLLSESHR